MIKKKANNLNILMMLCIVGIFAVGCMGGGQEGAERFLNNGNTQNQGLTNNGAVNNSNPQDEIILAQQGTQFFDCGSLDLSNAFDVSTSDEVLDAIDSSQGDEVILLAPGNYYFDVTIELDKPGLVLSGDGDVTIHGSPFDEDSVVLAEGAALCNLSLNGNIAD